jgi:hypothetical protein
MCNYEIDLGKVLLIFFSLCKLDIKVHCLQHVSEIYLSFRNVSSVLKIHGEVERIYNMYMSSSAKATPEKLIWMKYGGHLYIYFIYK